MSNVRSSNFSDLTATYGIKPDSTNGITISANGFDFRESGGCLYPLNKTKVVFTGTGADQSWVVPAGISYIFVKMWGAGGAHGRQSGWSFGAAGGGGGHTRGLISVTAGSTLTVKVGAGGRTAFNGSTYGGGGGYSESNTMGGGGGGSGYVIASAKLGGTFTGNLRIPAFAWDNDLDTGVSNYTMTAYGCQNLQNNIGAGVTVGGQGYLVIYY